MIAMPQSVSLSNSSFPSHQGSNSSCRLARLAVMCGVLAVLVFGAGSILVAQTAHFSGSTPISWIQSSPPQYFGEYFPGGAAVDNGGNIYLVETYGGYVFKLTPSLNGYTPSTIGTGLSEIVAVAVDQSGNVYMADYDDGRVIKETPSGASYIQSTAIDSTSSQRINPWGLGVDGKGNLYIADNVNRCVWKESPSSSGFTQSTVVSNLPYGITSIAVDGDGNVYFTDESDRTAVKETLVSGNYSESFVGIGGPGIPTAIAVDQMGNVFLGGVNLWTPSGFAYAEVLTNGTYLQSDFSIGQTSPRAIAVDGANNVYIFGNGSPSLKESPDYGNFGMVNIGSSSPKPVSMVFRFDTAGTLGSTAVLTQGATGLDFTDARTGTCVAGSSYNAADTCTIDVNFTPRYSGTRSGAALLKDAGGNVIASGFVHGSGKGPQVRFLPGTESVIVAGGLAAPTGVAVDGGGDVYSLDTNHSRLLKSTPSSGSYPLSTVADDLLGANGVAVDGAGNVYIADTGNNRVLKETPTITGLYTETTIASGVGSPEGIAVDGSGNVYITSSGLVLKVTPTAGSYTTLNMMISGLSYPSGIAVDGNCNLYIADTNNRRVLKETLTVDGYVESTLPVSAQVSPWSIAVDGTGNVYFGDEFSGNVFKEMLTAGGYVQSTMVSDLNTPGSFFGVAVDGNSNLYIGNSGNNSIVRVAFSNPPSVSFANAAIGSKSQDSPQTVAVENIGNVALTFPVPQTGSNPSIAANFTIDNYDYGDCKLVQYGPVTLAPGASCQLPISFTPAAAGALIGSLVLMDDNLNAAAPSYALQSIALTGTGTQATPTITWATPAPITYGTPLSSTQLNAAGSVSGTFTYSPAAGAVVSAGRATLTATFYPAESTDYTSATAAVTLDVNKATPLITWATPAPIIYGTALSSFQLGATASVPGTFTYNPTLGSIPSVGTDSLMVTFVPADSTDYTTATASVNLTVNPAPSFALSATPAALSVVQGKSGTSVIAVRDIAGFTGKVRFSVSGLPSGVSATFSPSQTATTSVLTVQAGGKAAVGTALVTVTGNSGSLTAATTIDLTVVAHKP